MSSEDLRARSERRSEDTQFDRRHLVDGERVPAQAPRADSPADSEGTAAGEATRAGDAAAAVDVARASEAAAVAETLGTVEAAEKAEAMLEQSGIRNTFRRAVEEASRDGARDAADGKAGVIVGAIIMFFIIFGPGIYNLLGLREERMIVVTAATMQRDTTWRLSGRVLLDGAPSPARVWAIATDDRGNRFAPPAVVTDASGAYAFAPVPARIAPAAEALARTVVASSDSVRLTSEVTVFARSLHKDSAQIGQVSETVRLSPSARTRWVKLPPSALLTVVFIFVLSVILGIAQGRRGGQLRKLQYYGNIVLAFLLTAAVVVFISYGLRHVNLAGTHGDVIALGFANVYKGTYVKDVAAEWLFSLTTPYQGTTGGAVSQGFGAPLWALLLACFGAGVFTVRVIVKQILDPVRLNDDSQFRARLQELVRHQVYILFAPVAAVFVYQMLVIGGMASQVTTVAFAMLASGLMLNSVLDRAVIWARGALEADDPVARAAEGRGDGGRDPDGPGDDEHGRHAGNGVGGNGHHGLVGAITPVGRPQTS